MVTPTVLATAADAVPTTQTTALSVCVAVLPAEGWVIPWATAWVTVHDPPEAIGQAQGFDPTVRPYRSSPPSYHQNTRCSHQVHRQLSVVDDVSSPFGILHRVVVGNDGWGSQASDSGHGFISKV